MIKAGLLVSSTSITYLTFSESIKCESKRTFYNDEPQQVSVSETTPSEPQLSKFVKEEQSIESLLEPRIKSAREELYKYFELSKKYYIEKSEQYFKAEREVFSTASSLHDRREELFPDALYVITGGLFGSVLARKKNILIRVLAPVATGLLSFKLFFPKTFNNVFGFLENVEKEKLPAVHTKQVEFAEKSEELVKSTSSTIVESSKEVEGFLAKVKRSIGEYTGLNVDQIITEKKK